MGILGCATREGIHLSDRSFIARPREKTCAHLLTAYGKKIIAL